MPPNERLSFTRAKAQQNKKKRPYVGRKFSGFENENGGNSKEQNVVVSDKEKSDFDHWVSPKVGR